MPPYSFSLPGCGSSGTPGRDARYVDSQGTQTVVSLDKINIQDWASAADQMAPSMLVSGVLDRAPEQPAVPGIGRITNKTTQLGLVIGLLGKICLGAQSPAAEYAPMAKSPPDDFCQRLRWDQIDPDWVDHLVALAYREDMAGGGLADIPDTPGDATTETVIKPGVGEARLIAREPMVVAGLPVVEAVLRHYGNELGAVMFNPEAVDGTAANPGDCLGELTGDKAAILSAERVMLNFLQRLTGVATATRAYVDALGNSPTRLLDTRKTTPGYRMLEKYAVAQGGGWNHRLGLHDRIMLKDNHLAAAGAGQGGRLAAAVSLARQKRPDLGVEVEVDALEQIPPVIEVGADVILLDNFSLEQLAEAVALIDGQCLTEASGGVTIERLPELAALGLDFISTGATVHQAMWVDIGLDWQ